MRNRLRHSPTSGGPTAPEVSDLVQRYAALAAEVDKSVGGKIDAITDAAGQTLLLRHAQESLRRSEEQLRAVIEASIDCIITADQEMNIEEFNPAAERTFGYRREEVIGRPISETIIPPHLRRAHDRGVQHFRRTGEGPIVGQHVESVGMRADGTEFPVELAVTRIGSGTPPRFAAFIRDITEKRAQQLETERLFELSLDMICLVDSAGRFKKLNPSWQRVLGYELKEMLGRPFIDFVHPDDVEATTRAAADLAAHGQLLNFENRYQTRDGSTRWLAWSARFVPEQGEIYAVARDVTEKKQAEVELGRLKHEKEIILACIADGVFVLDREGRVLFENPAAAKMLGFAENELVGKPAHPIIHHTRADGSHYPREQCPFYLTMITGRPHSGADEVLWRKDGSSFPIEYNCAPLRNGSGETLGAVVTFRDITEQQRAAKELRRSEQTLRELADAMPQVVWTATPDGVVTYLNQYAADYTGRSIEELLSETRHSLFHPADAAQASEKWQRGTRSGETFQVECRIRRHDGAYRWHLTRGTPIRDESGAILRWIGTNTDIDEQKRTEERLRKSEESLQLAQEVAQTGSWEMRLDGPAVDPARPLHWSDETYRIFGLEPGSAEMTQGRFFSFVHPDDTERLQREVHEMIASSGVLSTDHRIILGDGTERTVREQARVIIADDGTRRVVGVVRDVTERVRAETLLRQQAALLELAHDAIIVRNYHDGCVTFWNSGAERVYGWTASEAIGRPIAELVFADDEEFARIAQALARAGEYQGEIRHKTRDLREVTMSSRSKVVRSPDGKPQSVFSINTDITEHKKLEQQFLRAQRLESIGTLAAGVAHDLNNILVPILMAAPLLREESSPEDRDKLLDLVQTSAERGSGIIKQVLTFARGVDGDRMLMQPAYLIRDVAKIVEETFPKTISIRATYHDNLRSIEADMTQLHQVLLNLCVNARDAMPNGGRLAFGADNFDVDEHFAAMTPGATPGPHVVITVTDTGSGMPPALISKIFDPFFTTKEVGKGTGLGLSTVLGIVQSHGGFVQVYSEVNRGTTFKVFLPAAENAMPDESSPVATHPAGAGETVLLVDDEPSIREVAKALLTHYGYNVRLAEDGPSALALFASEMQQIDVVVTDMTMPFMHGSVLVRALRKMRADLPIIATTGRSDEWTGEELSDMGVGSCITKPYSQEVLLTALRDVLHPNKSTP